MFKGGKHPRARLHYQDYPEVSGYYHIHICSPQIFILFSPVFKRDSVRIEVGLMGPPSGYEHAGSALYPTLFVWAKYKAL